jgi:hypothetical protein
MLGALLLRTSTLCFLWVLLLTLATHAQEFRPKILQKKHYHPKLTEAQTILVHTSATIHHKPVNADPLLHIIRSQMERVGYTVITQSSQAHDVTIEIRCEEPDRSTWSHAPQQPIATFTLGPPCILQYFLQGAPQEWQRIDRIVFNEGVSTVKHLSRNFSAREILPFSSAFLSGFEFPLLLAAEWYQIERLVTQLEDPILPLAHRKKVLFLLGEIHATEAFPSLLEATHDPELAVAATTALGHFGGQARPHLFTILTTSSHPDLQVAAAHSLGQVQGETGDTSLTSFFLELLTSPHIGRTVQTEIVWALGKAPDFKAFATLQQFELEIWQIHSNDPQLQQLREAIDWSIREVRQGGHTDDYE